MNDKGISDITVSEIITILDINRGTFYYHYQYLFDLRNQIVDNFIKETTDLLFNSYDSERKINYKFLSKYLIDFFIEKNEIFNIFFEYTDGLSMLEKSIITTVIDLEDLNVHDYKSIFEINFIISGVIKSLRDWNLNFSNLSKSDLRILLLDILQKF